MRIEYDILNRLIIIWNNWYGSEYNFNGNNVFVVTTMW